MAEHQANGEFTHPQPPAHWETLDEKLYAECRVYRVVRRQSRHPDGRQAEFFIQHAPDWVQVLALTPNRHIVLVQQYRHGARKLTWEVPGGVVDPGENPIQSGVRELREETGYTGGEPLKIGDVMPNPALADNHSHFVLVPECRLTHPTAFDPNEELIVRTVPIEQAFQMAGRGEFVHAITLNALFFLQYWLQANQP